MSSRGAFTLFEVLISLLVISIAILSTVALFPVGVKSAAQSRYKILASAKAMDLMHLYSNSMLTVFQNDTRDVGLNNELTAQNIREAGLLSQSRAFDFEQVIMRSNSAAIPLPMHIARRLESDNDEIRDILDNGGLLFYLDPNPFHNTDYMVGMHHARWKGVSVRTMEEYKKLIFAVKGFAQHNAINNHPIQNWPFYEMYPFPPCGDMPQVKWVYTLQNSPTPWTHGNGQAYNHEWTGPQRTLDPVTRYQGQNWHYFADRQPSSLWGQSRAAFDELIRYGWGPAWVKLSSYATTDYDTNYGVTGIKKTGDKRVPPLPPKASLPLGERVQEDKPDYFDSLPATVINPANDGVRPVDAAITDPGALELMIKEVQAINGFPFYDWHFDDEIGTASDERLPSMGQRRMYRKMAHQLWQVLVESTLWNIQDADLTTADQFDPFTHAFTLEELYANPEMLHPARVLAMSYIGHAAMFVTGMEGPFMGFDPLRWKNNKGVRKNNPKDDKYYYGDPIADDVDMSDKLPGASSEQDGSQKLIDHARPADVERQWALTAHENALRWAIAYANLYPYDWGAPRPMNRQSMMDKPLYTVDMFDATGVARRTSGDWDTENEPFFSAIGNGYRGFERHWGIYSKADEFTGPLMQRDNWQEWEDRGIDRLVGSRVAHNTLMRPFAVAERTRQLVFWSVNWMDYQDFEQVPSCPIDYSYHQGLDNQPLSLWDHPEMRYIWISDTRQKTYSMVFSTASKRRGLDRSKKSWIGVGQYGADRNNNGVYDEGKISPEARLRATMVARFNFYDPRGFMTVTP